MADACGVHDRNRGLFLVACLSGRAADYVTMNMGRDVSFHNISALLTGRYAVQNELLITRQRLLKLDQGGLTIDEYTNRFLDLMHRSPPEDETDRVIFYLNGMASEVATAVWKTDIRTLDDAIHVATSYARGASIISPPAAMDIGSTEANAMLRGPLQAQARQQNSFRRPNVECFYCHKLGHVAKECRKRKRDQSSAANSVGDINENDVVCYSVPVGLPVLTTQWGNHQLRMLVDSGASRNFVLQSTVTEKNMRTVPCAPFTIRFAGNESQKITTKVTLSWATEYERVFLDFFVFSGGRNQFDAILGMPWFKKINPRIDWARGTIRINGKWKAFTTPPKPTATMALAENLEPADEYFMAKLNMIGPEEKTDDIPTEIRKVLDDYKEITSGVLPKGAPNRAYKHQIETGDAEPTAVPPRKMSPKELVEVESQLKDLLEKEYIRPSMSPWCAPLVFVKKKDGTLRMCVDYRSLNKVTKKAKYPIPRTDEALEQIGRNRVFSTLDLKSGYHQIPMAEESIEKTAFGTRFGQFEFMVMPFGLCNAPATFMATMNQLFRGDDHVIVYMDDILIMSRNKEEHVKHVQQVLQKLKDNKFFINLKKCQFMNDAVEFLGHEITQEGLKPAMGRVRCIREWPTPTNASELRSFLGLSNYYRKFIPNFSKEAASLWDLTSTNNEFLWTASHDQAFNRLKQVFTDSLVLAYPDANRPFIIETDTSKLMVGGVLLQKDENGNERPVAFESKKLTPTQKNYSAYELELYGLLHNLRTFRCFVEGTDFLVRTDHQGLLPILHASSNDTHPKLARWLDEIALYQPFRLEYKKGSTNFAADLLSRREIASATIKEGPAEGLRLIFVDEQGRVQLIKKIHDENGHLGVSATLEKLKRQYYWQRMQVDVQETVRACDVCQRHRNDGATSTDVAVTPLDVSELFERWGIDVMGPMDETVDGKKYVILAIDHFSRWTVARAIASPTAAETVRFIEEEIVRNYGIPRILISDQGTNFMSQQLQSYASDIGIELRRTTPYHPRANGATERANQLFKQILSRIQYERGYRRWDELVPKVVWHMRMRKHTTTNFSPYELVYGRTPRTTRSDVSRQIDVAEARRLASSNWENFRQKMASPNHCETLQIGQSVLVRTHNRSPLAAKWEGPFPIADIRGEMVKILRPSGLSWQNRQNAKRYFHPQDPGGRIMS